MSKKDEKNKKKHSANGSENQDQAGILSASVPSGQQFVINKKTYETGAGPPAEGADQVAGMDPP